MRDFKKHVDFIFKNDKKDNDETRLVYRCEEQGTKKVFSNNIGLNLCDNLNCKMCRRISKSITEELKQPCYACQGGGCPVCCGTGVIED